MATETSSLRPFKVEALCHADAGKLNWPLPSKDRPVNDYFRSTVYTILNQYRRDGGGRSPALSYRDEVHRQRLWVSRQRSISGVDYCFVLR